VFCECFVFCNKFVYHGGHWGNVAQALAQWQHLVASHEATNALHWEMCIAPYHPGGMAIEIVVDIHAFFVIVTSMFAHIVS